MTSWNSCKSFPEAAILLVSNLVPRVSLLPANSVTSWNFAPNPKSYWLYLMNIIFIWGESEVFQHSLDIICTSACFSCSNYFSKVFIIILKLRISFSSGVALLNRNTLPRFRLLCSQTLLSGARSSKKRLFPRVSEDGLFPLFLSSNRPRFCEIRLAVCFSPANWAQLHGGGASFLHFSANSVTGTKTIFSSYTCCFCLFICLFVLRQTDPKRR